MAWSRSATAASRWRPARTVAAARATVSAVRTAIRPWRSRARRRRARPLAARNACSLRLRRVPDGIGGARAATAAAVSSTVPPYR